jgi:membrane protein
MIAVFRLFYKAFMRFVEDDGWAIASHIALTILMSMFPFLIFLTALAGFFGSKELADTVANTLFQTWPEQVAAPIAAEIHNVLTHSQTSPLTLGVALTLYFSSNGVEALRVGLNRAYEVRDTRPWWLTRLESIFFVLIGALALLAFGFLIVLAPLIWAGALHFAPGLQTLEPILNFGRFAIAAALLLPALVLMHKFLPAGRRTIRDTAPGIMLTFVLWVGAGIAFGLYLSEFARNYVNTYAGLASVMIALVFLYTLAAIFIFGAELNSAIIQPDARG